MTVILPEPEASFEWVPAPWPSHHAADGDGDWVLRCRPLAAVARHFFTTRVLQLRADSPRAQDDWTRVASAIGVPLAQLRRMRQVHGCATFALRSDRESNATGAPASTHEAALARARPGGTSGEPPRVAEPPRAESVASQSQSRPQPEQPWGAMRSDEPEADALVTDRPEVALVVRVADCVPLLMADPRTGAVAAVHAGWRGTAAGIAAVAVRRLQREYGSDPADVIAAIGPSIGPCCYQVGPEVRDAFLQAGHAQAAVDRWCTPDAGDRWRLDSWAANRDQLIAAGLSPAQVHVAGLCTLTHVTHFYSYRAEGPSTGRLLGVIRRST